MILETFGQIICELSGRVATMENGLYIAKIVFLRHGISKSPLAVEGPTL